MRKEEEEMARNEEQESDENEPNLGIQDEGAESFIVPKDSFADG